MSKSDAVGGKTGGFGEAPLPLLAARKLVMSEGEKSVDRQKIGELPCPFTKGAWERQENLPTRPRPRKRTLHESCHRRGNAVAACMSPSPAVTGPLHAAFVLPPPGSHRCTLHGCFPRRFQAAAPCIWPPTAGNALLHAARALPTPFPGRCTLHRRFLRRFRCMAADTLGNSPSKPTS